MTSHLVRWFHRSVPVPGRPSVGRAVRALSFGVLLCLSTSGCLYTRLRIPLDKNFDVTDLGALTLREIADRFGSVESMHTVVKALKDYAAMQNQEGLANKRRGEMIDRDLVSKDDIRQTLDEVEPELVRYPGLDSDAFRRRVGAFLGAEDE